MNPAVLKTLKHRIQTAGTLDRLRSIEASLGSETRVLTPLGWLPTDPDERSQAMAKLRSLAARRRKELKTA